MSSSERTAFNPPGRSPRSDFVPLWARARSLPAGNPSALTEGVARLLAAAAQDEARISRSPAWRDYSRRVEAAVQAGTASLDDLRLLADAAPPSAHNAFAELASLIEENDADLLAESGLNLARDLLDADQASALAVACLQFAATRSPTERRAQALLQAANGGGRWFDRFEFQAPVLLRELSSPIALGSFGLAGLAARASSLAVLARVGRVNLSTLVLSETAALAAEVPTMVLARRAATYAVTGESSLLSPSAMGEEVLHMLAPFALLRVAGNVNQWAGLPGGNRIRGMSATLQRGAEAVAAGRRFATEVGAVVAGHSLNSYFGLERSGGDAFSRLADGIMTVAHMRLAGHILDRTGIFRMPAGYDAWRARLLAEALSSRGPRAPGGGNFWEFGDGGLLLAAAGRAGRRSRSSGGIEETRDTLSLMSTDGDGVGSNRPPPPSSAPRETAPAEPKEPERLELIKELLAQRFDEYTQSANGEDVVMTRTMRGLKWALDRMGERPDLANDEVFAQRLSELELEFQRLSEKQTITSRALEAIRMMLRRSKTVATEARESDPPKLSTESPAPESGRASPEAAERDGEALSDQQKERSKMATSLRNLHVALKNIRDNGWSEQGRERLDSTLSRLNELFQTTVWKIPGMQTLKNYREQQNVIEDRRLGALLGFGVRAEFARHDSPVMRERRAETATGERSDEFELELLHRTLLAFGRTKPKTKDFFQTVQKIAVDYNARMDSMAAMLLYGEALQAMAYRNVPTHDLIAHLSQHANAGDLREQLLILESLKDSQGEPGEGLEIIGLDATAADFLASGLLAMVRSEGDPEALVNWLRAGRDQQANGFHPSIALSLYGATHGRSHLPPEALIEDQLLESLLKRLDED